MPSRASCCLPHARGLRGGRGTAPAIRARSARIRTQLRTRPGEYDVQPPRSTEEPSLRQERQRRVEEGDTHFTAIIWEPAVTALTCERHERTGQLTHLLEVSQRQNITLQLLPIAESLIAGMSGAFVAFSFGVEANVEAVTLENPANTNVVEAPEDLSLYVNVFDQLRSAALSPDESAERLRQILDGGPQHRGEGS
ncbi:Scr1 family TA system antitoxin-like transcriptional regulator [Streptomyces sp. TM32]|uniref:Scr1 family TA system antitoxin-like transcriptional regulator n=1 Tax=Streptomyces sp. TM32 TaxID=1652669 RepID=UPI0020B13278|nr:Scr1 family TA system antitoxin-like transcriptional regulator [Streptomyces sp. TM32]